VPDIAAAAQNIGGKLVRRVARFHTPFVRQARRVSRMREQAVEVAGEIRVLRDIAHAARGREPIVVGPWLSEVGYEVLYWIPFLRWFRDRYRLDADRLVVISRGGVAPWYADITDRYLDIFDLMDASTFAARNEARRTGEESGGQKQTASGALDTELLDLARARLGLDRIRACHPSLMYRLFRQFWLANRALDVVTAHTRFTRMSARDAIDLGTLPRRFVAVKFYTGAAIPDTPAHRAVLREIVQRLSSDTPVVLLDTGMSLDEHEDYPFAGIPGVTSLRGFLTAQNNLAVQTQVIAAASAFVGTCGSVAWLAPLLGVPAVAAYVDDRFLLSHLFVARHAYRQAGAAPFLPLDLHGAAELGALDRSLAPLTAASGRSPSQGGAAE
jgi:hypothetical protein